MKKIISLILTVAMLLGCTLVLSGCGEMEDDGAEIMIALGNVVYDLDPGDYYVDDNEAQLLSLLFEPLFRINEKGKLENAVAKSYKVNKSERTITVKLRKTYWSDGKLVTSQDFLYAWRDRIIDGAKANPAAALFYDIEYALEIKNGTQSDLFSFGVKAPEDDTLIITYREGANVDQLLRNLACIATAPVREDVARIADDHWSKMVDSVVTNGPFTISAYNIEGSGTTLSSAFLKLGRNAGYHRDPEGKDLTSQVLPSMLATFWVGSEAVELTYQQVADNAVFFIGNSSDINDRVVSKKNATVVDTLSTYCFAFNTTNPLLADVNVRKALSLALDRSEIQKTLIYGKAAEGFYPTTTGLLSTSADVDGAKALLKNVNLKTLGNKFTLTVNNDADSIAIGEMAKEAWEELGFKVTLKKVDFTSSKVMDATTSSMIDIFDSTVQGKVKDASYGNFENIETTVESKKVVEYEAYDVIGFDWQMYSTDKFVALCALTSNMNGCGVNMVNNEVECRTSITAWTDEAYDELLAQAYACTDSKQRTDLLNQAETLLMEELPVVPVLYNQNYAYINSNLSGVKTDGYGNFIFTKANLKNYQEYFLDKMLGLDDEEESSEE